MRDSTWGFAITEVVHLLGLAIFGGAVLLLNMRFLNLIFKTQSAQRIARELLPLTAGGALVMFFSGALLLVSGPMRYYYNPAFRWKMALFFIAVFVQFILQVRIARWYREEEPPTLTAKLAAAVSIALWLGVGLAGRAIGYV